ncbi:hypothetical protein Nepgr_006517 [Nepenthes gracilis]|uniref:Uncharacterized protein n=1 Tax=Nepenthes gracilis TaxID=150966 RepID=A0AAD3XHE6_NEPGR|nr:hypothetical protein Nepgr_006517 [Nepenthes gracilis]
MQCSVICAMTISARGFHMVKLDPKLEFDHEVYPLGLLPNAGMVRKQYCIACFGTFFSSQNEALQLRKLYNLELFHASYSFFLERIFHNCR